MSKGSKRLINLNTISNEDLLQTRLCDLPIELKNNWVQNCVIKLNKELSSKGIRLKPHVWISDDWFSPDGVPGFAVPFFIMHPRLIALEKEMIGEVEGGDRAWCMMLMRHEVGHCIDNAYHLRKNKRRQLLFGLTSTPYPESYKPNIKSRQFVRHLDGHYAQAHPDEDWAETFAVWLTPRSSWRKVYADWPALKKLNLLNDILENIKGELPLVKNRDRMDEISNMKMTVGEYYKIKKQRLGLNKSPVMIRDLKKIFSKEGELPAWRFVNDSKTQIIGQVAKNTRLQHYKIMKMLREVQSTCRQENLKVDKLPGVSRKQLINLITKKSEGFVKSSSPRIIM
ncbi:MAG: putative zinc-binding metallopeptidase [Bacteriovoracaceae bacterium]|nr:putative zinc-binding metallopeptidase [Bacteriovoracaceae bacterium]